MANRRINRNDITLAVDAHGGMYVAQGNPAYEALDAHVGTDYHCEVDLYFSQIYHRCAALTPNGWRIMTPSDAEAGGYQWTRFPSRWRSATGSPVYVGKAD